MACPCLRTRACAPAWRAPDVSSTDRTQHDCCRQVHAVCRGAVRREEGARLFPSPRDHGGAAVMERIVCETRASAQRATRLLSQAGGREIVSDTTESCMGGCVCAAPRRDWHSLIHSQTGVRVETHAAAQPRDAAVDSARRRPVCPRGPRWASRSDCPLFPCICGLCAQSKPVLAASPCSLKAGSCARISQIT